LLVHQNGFQALVVASEQSQPFLPNPDALFRPVLPPAHLAQVVKEMRQPAWL